MSDGLSAEAPRTWHLPKLQVLDHPVLINKLVELKKQNDPETVPGTHKPYDAQKVSGDIIDMVFSELADAKGRFHPPTALTAFAALAGFSAQMVIRETLVKLGTLSETQTFMLFEGKNGDRHDLSDIFDLMVTDKKPGNASIYNMVIIPAQKVGAQDLPDIEDILIHVGRTAGGDKFGIPRVPPEYQPQASPIELLDKFWNPIRNYMVLNVDSPVSWPVVLSLAGQRAIARKEMADPAMAAKLFMEVAIPMSRINPDKVHFASFQSY